MRNEKAWAKVEKRRKHIAAVAEGETKADDGEEDEKRTA